jgi:hypothetical protein
MDDEVKNQPSFSSGAWNESDKSGVVHCLAPSLTAGKDLSSAMNEATGNLDMSPHHRCGVVLVQSVSLHK